MTRIEGVSNVARAHAAREVAATRTPTTPAQIRAALASAWKRETGSTASSSTLDVLTAHVSHETARGDRMFNYNFGGIKGQSPSGTTARYATRELDTGGAEHHIVDGFRAYRTIGEGASDYLHTLRARYPAAVEAASRGDVDGFASALKARGYFTAHLEDYAASLRGLVHAPSVAASSAAAAPPPDLPPVVSVAALAPPTDASAYPTVTAVGRVLDAVAAMTAQVGAPISDDGRATTVKR